MPAIVSPRFAFSIALVGLACGSADAQLQWQSTGVEQVSHNTRLDRAMPPSPQAVKPQPTAQRQARPEAKAPTAVAKRKPAAPKPQPQPKSQPQVRAGDTDAAQRAMHSEQVARQGAAILQQANRRPAPGRPAVQPAAAQAGVVPTCHTGGCQGGPMIDPSFGGECGGPDCGIGCGITCNDVGCGGEVGCCGEVGCGGECGCGGACGVCSYESCRDRGAVPLILFVPPIRHLTFSAGVQGFKGPLDGPNDTIRDRGNFGFNESVSISGPMSWLPWKSLGYQVGYRATHNQLQGSSAGSTSDSHTQHFLTAGLFRRKPVGLQYGVVYDFLQDERIERAEFSQLRGLISVTNPKGLEWGFQFATGLKDATVGDDLLYDPVDQYLLFCRKKNPCGGGELRLFGGVTDDSDGIIGGDVDIPLGNRLSFRSGFAYLIPEEDGMGAGAEEEHWNLGMNLVWHYGKRAKSSYNSPFRPLFNVADNGSFFVDDSMD